MSDFKIDLKKNSTELVMVFTGSIDEDVQFPNVDFSDVQSLVFDLNQIKSINSVGIREWLNWIKPIAAKFPIQMINCPKSMVFQFNMVEGFLPKNAQVKSLYVPFYCEKCDREENLLFKVGEHVKAQEQQVQMNFQVSDFKLCEESPCELEIDVAEAKYFQFMKK